LNFDPRRGLHGASGAQGPPARDERATFSPDAKNISGKKSKVPSGAARSGRNKDPGKVHLRRSSATRPSGPRRPRRGGSAWLGSARLGSARLRTEGAVQQQPSPGKKLRRRRAEG
ncbi:unnamed protein product, partial [Tetraodon nigroviridis]